MFTAEHRVTPVYDDHPIRLLPIRISWEGRILKAMPPVLSHSARQENYWRRRADETRHQLLSAENNRLKEIYCDLLEHYVHMARLHDDRLERCALFARPLT